MFEKLRKLFKKSKLQCPPPPPPTPKSISISSSLSSTYHKTPSNRNIDMVGYWVDIYIRK